MDNVYTLQQMGIKPNSICGHGIICRWAGMIVYKSTNNKDMSSDLILRMSV